MKVFHFGIILGALGFVIGCTDKSVLVDPGILDFDSSATNVQSDAKMRVIEMKPEDIIVSVNGVALSRKTFDKLILFRQQHLMQEKNADQMVVNKKIEAFQQSYINNFVGQRLMVDHAFKAGVVTTNEVLSHVGKAIAKVADKRGKTPEQFLKGLGEERHFFQYEIAVSFIMDKLIHDKIPPKAEVTGEFLAEVKKEVKRMNAEAAATNAVFKARLADWKQQILAKKLDFGKFAKTLSFEDEDNKMDDDGVWGEFEQGDLPSAQMQAAVFALPVGAISDVLESDNGYHLVKVLSITPEVKNEQGRVTERERRKLAQIYLEKVPLLIEESDIVMTHDLKKQMQLQAVNEYVARLTTNGINKVEYPHGVALY